MGCTRLVRTPLVLVLELFHQAAHTEGLSQCPARSPRTMPRLGKGRAKLRQAANSVHFANNQWRTIQKHHEQP